MDNRVIEPFGNVKALWKDCCCELYLVSLLDV